MLIPASEGMTKVEFSDAVQFMETTFSSMVTVVPGLLVQESTCPKPDRIRLRERAQPAKIVLGACA